MGGQARCVQAHWPLKQEHELQPSPLLHIELEVQPGRGTQVFPPS
jgi:hypothetical protein